MNEAVGRLGVMTAAPEAADAGHMKNMVTLDDGKQK